MSFESIKSLLLGINDIEDMKMIKRKLIHLLKNLNNEKDEIVIQSGLERKKLEDRSSVIDPNKSLAYAELKKKNWDILTQNELLSIAQLLAKKADVELDREAKRRKQILLIWFHENFEKIKPYMDNLFVEYAP